MASRLLFLSAALLSVSACANEPPAAGKREYEMTPRPAPASKRNDPLPQSLRDALQADAAKRSGVAADQPTIVSSEKITWTDGALGCPQPGQMYTQATVPGFRVSVRAGDQTLLYHAAESGHFIQCPVRRVERDDVVAE